MQKQILIFPGLGYKNINQANILIYNKNNLVCSDRTYNGRLKVCLKTNNIYKIYVESKYENKSYSVYISTYYSKYTLPLNSSYICNNKSVTFLLTDLNYDNLPIEKGMIILWQKQ